MTIEEAGRTQRITQAAAKSDLIREIGGQWDQLKWLSDRREFLRSVMPGSPVELCNELELHILGVNNKMDELLKLIRRAKGALGLDTSDEQRIAHLIRKFTDTEDEQRVWRSKG